MASQRGGLEVLKPQKDWLRASLRMCKYLSSPAWIQSTEAGEMAREHRSTSSAEHPVGLRSLIFHPAGGAVSPTSLTMPAEPGVYALVQLSLDFFLSDCPKASMSPLDEEVGLLALNAVSP